MRILVLNYEYPPLGGGAGVATAALAHGLVKRGIAVDVVTSSAGDDGERRSADRFTVNTRSTGLRLFRVRSRRIGVHEAGMMGAASYLVNALPLVRRLLQTCRYDVVHVFFSLPTGALLPFVELGGVPVVVSLRGSDVPGYDPFNISMQRVHRVLTPLTRWIWRRADRVVPVCESLGRLATETCPELPYTVVPNGVDLNLFHPAEPSRSEDGKWIRCLAVARLVERKGLGELIRAFALLPRGRYQLEIVGNGPDERSLRELAARLGVGREIVFSGPLDREGVARRYRDADLFTLPSSAEAFGNVFAEALASGLPIVGSDVGGIPELVEHGVNGLLVTPGKPEILAQAIQYLAGDHELRAEMRIRNRAKAEATLDWTQVTTRYVSIYEGVMRQLPAPSLVSQPVVSTL
jgi:glycosyltransferase involved in cell wall biosynthesis